MFRALASTLKNATAPSKDANKQLPRNEAAPDANELDHGTIEKLQYNLCSEVCDVDKAFITALVDVYCGRRSVDSFCEASLERAKTCLKLLPPLLPVESEGTISLSILRHAHLACGYSLDGRRLYTSEEKKEALGKYLSGKATRESINADLGMSIKSVTQLTNAFAAYIGHSHSSMRQLRTYIKQNPQRFHHQLVSFVPPVCGRKPFVPALENDILKSIFAQHKEHGVGLNTQECGVLYKQAVHHVGFETNNNAKINAACSKSFVRANTLHRVEKSIIPSSVGGSAMDGSVTMEGAFTKDSSISTKRAAAADPAIGLSMRRQFRKVYDDFCRTGVLPSGVDQPSPSQVYNGDEIGFDANGKHSATFGFKSNRVRSFRLQEGEKSPFWTTLFYWSRADGSHPIPPTIVHQSDMDDKIRADKFLHLPSDWTVHTTESGYMDQTGFFLVAKSFIEHSGACAENPQFVYIDAHESHWCPDALRMLRDAHVYVFFLQSNNSINDQVNDMGLNAIVKHIYGREYGCWRLKYSGLKYNSVWFNYVIRVVWNAFIAWPSRSRTTIGAFERSLLCPLVVEPFPTTVTSTSSTSTSTSSGMNNGYTTQHATNATITTTNSSNNGAIVTSGSIQQTGQYFAASISSTSTSSSSSSSSSMNAIRTNQELHRNRALSVIYGSGNANESADEYNVSTHTISRQQAWRLPILTPTSTNITNYNDTVRMVSKRIFKDTYVTPAQQIKAVQDEYKKKSGVTTDNNSSSKDKENLRYPSTYAGRFVTDTDIATAYTITEGRAAKKNRKS